MAGQPYYNPVNGQLYSAPAPMYSQTYGVPPMPVPRSSYYDYQPQSEYWR